MYIKTSIILKKFNSNWEFESALNNCYVRVKILNNKWNASRILFCFGIIVDLEKNFFSQTNSIFDLHSAIFIWFYFVIKIYFR